MKDGLGKPSRENDQVTWEVCSMLFKKIYGFGRAKVASGAYEEENLQVNEEMRTTQLPIRFEKQWGNSGYFARETGNGT